MKLQPIGKNTSVYVSDVHKFGTDAILLADFANPKTHDAACDLGTGCGIIPLLWCRRNYPEHITAVDIQADACALLLKSVELNLLGERIKVVNADLRKLDGVLSAGGFDLVCMNPPYKVACGGEQSPNESRRIARHEVECTLIDIVKSAARLLKFGGRFCLCHRPERLCDIVCDMRAAGIEPKRLRMVHQRVGSPPSLILCEGKKGAHAGLSVLPPLYIEAANGGRSDEMREIYGEFAYHAKANGNGSESIG